MIQFLFLDTTQISYSMPFIVWIKKICYKIFMFFIYNMKSNLLKKIIKSYHDFLKDKKYILTSLFGSL